MEARNPERVVIIQDLPHRSWPRKTRSFKKTGEIANFLEVFQENLFPARTRRKPEARALPKKKKKKICRKSHSGASSLWTNRSGVILQVWIECCAFVKFNLGFKAIRYYHACLLLQCFILVPVLLGKSSEISPNFTCTHVAKDNIKQLTLESKEIKLLRVTEGKSFPLKSVFWHAYFQSSVRNNLCFNNSVLQLHPVSYWTTAALSIWETGG